MNYKNIGEYKHFDSCRFCGSNKVEQVINLGYMPLAGGFIKTAKQIDQERLYPLELNFCKKCFLLQVNSSINPDRLFKNYFYFSSSIKTLTEHFENVVQDTKNSFGNPKNKFIIEIGSNDGGFIKALTRRGFKALGVDPADNVVKPVIKKGVPIINDYFTEKLAQRMVKKYGKADAIYSFHTMAHIEDMIDVMRGVKKLLKNDGYLAMEIHYLGSLLKETQYDMIYHEHQYYYSLLALRNFFKQFDLEIFNVKRVGVRAGSITILAQHKGSKREITQNVKKLLAQEKKDGLDKTKTYLNFAKKINKRKIELISLLDELKSKRNKIIGYGASGRGTIIANYSNLTEYLEYIVDDAPAKHGALLPGTHHKIYPSSKMVKDKVDYALLFAWPFASEVKKRNPNYKGKFIIPLPKVKII